MSIWRKGLPSSPPPLCPLEREEGQVHSSWGSRREAEKEGKKIICRKSALDAGTIVIQFFNKSCNKIMTNMFVLESPIGH